ncbi:hypothetical protein [Staphylococcus epidermidis]|uniref:hypothetical protein n=1 Tax=Staphylococcus epidermidis TaxID=1282 RepID=UPI0038334143
MSWAQRLLSIYSRLINSYLINKMTLANEFNVDERTIKRDMQDIRNYLYDNNEWFRRPDVKFNYSTNHYYIEKEKQELESDNFKTLIIYLAQIRIAIPKVIHTALITIVNQLFPNERKDLIKIINTIQFEDIDINFQLIYKLNDALLNHSSILLIAKAGQNIKSIPIKITYFKGSYRLKYYNKECEDFINLNDMSQIKIINEQNHNLQYYLLIT